MTAIFVVLTSQDSGAPFGFGLICTQARYCSVKSVDGTRLDRLFLVPREWRAVETEAALGLTPGPVPTDSAVARAFHAHRGVVVQYLHSIPIDAPPAEISTVLDGHLWAQRLDQ